MNEIDELIVSAGEGVVEIDASEFARIILDVCHQTSPAQASRAANLIIERLAEMMINVQTQQ